MRSFTLKTALAAMIVSTAFAGAFAAGMPTAADANNPEGPSPFDQPAPADGHAWAPYQADARMPAMAGGAAMHATATRVGYHPRLALIVSELGGANHRIGIDRHHGTLTRAEYAKLRHEERGIRQAAFTTADRHGGKLPRVAFNELQAKIHRLNQDIGRDARA